MICAWEMQKVKCSTVQALLSERKAEALVDISRGSDLESCKLYKTEVLVTPTSMASSILRPSVDSMSKLVHATNLAVPRVFPSLSTAYVIPSIIACSMVSRCLDVLLTFKVVSSPRL